MGMRTPPDDGGRGMPPWSAALVVVVLVATLGIAVRGWLLVGPSSHSAPKPASPPAPRASLTPSPAPPGAPGSDEENANGAIAATSTVVAGPPGPYGPTAAWVVAENAKPGTPNWALGNRARQHQIEGYADRVSIDVSGTVHLLVSTTAPTFKVEAYRMGYYGGAGGRLVWTSPDQPGAVQPAYTVSPGTNMVETAWKPSLTVTTDAAWPPGQYLFKLVASSGFQSYVPLTIRDDASRAAYLVDSDVTTWQAYNLYGGYDLYQGPSGRSRIVSFDRPYALGDGSGDFLGNEFHVVSLVESLGLDVAYSTDVDVHEHPDQVLDHRAFISLGHDEYYSLAMRNGLQAARDHGVNLMFLGANAIYRHIRFEPSALGPNRHEVDYKDAKEDPLNGKNGADTTPAAWRYPPNNNPESTIIGNYYQCNPVVADMVISDPSSWIFAGTGVTAGQHLSGVVGTEYDHYDPKAPGPRNVDVAARSPLVCQGRPDYADMTYYSAASGAGVFASGTLLWIPKLDPNCAMPCPGRVVTRVTENLLAAFGAGPAGKTHPSTGNWHSMPTGIASLSPPATGPSPSPKASRKKH
ncbi:MAG: hypothetical protein QOD49_559 [Actinomycetota bacterium]|nr:hypothetical protein [Actinomycetota bacterium]